MVEGGGGVGMPSRCVDARLMVEIWVVRWHTTPIKNMKWKNWNRVESCTDHDEHHRHCKKLSTTSIFAAGNGHSTCPTRDHRGTSSQCHFSSSRSREVILCDIRWLADRGNDTAAPTCKWGHGYRLQSNAASDLCFELSLRDSPICIMHNATIYRLAKRVHTIYFDIASVSVSHPFPLIHKPRILQLTRPIYQPEPIPLLYVWVGFARPTPALLNMYSVGWWIKRKPGRSHTVPLRFFVLYMLTEPITTIGGCTQQQVSDSSPILSVCLNSSELEDEMIAYQICQVDRTYIRSWSSSAVLHFPAFPRESRARRTW